jgi:hypothetical protein
MYTIENKKTREENTIEQLSAEIERLQRAYDNAAGYYFCCGVATMGIIFLLVEVFIK